MKIGFYPGCSLEGSSREYSESVVALAKAFDIELVHVPDWNCCGASAAHNMNHELALSLPARILALAEKAGMDEVLVPCAACYSKLMVTHHELTNDADLSEKINIITDLPYTGKIKILNVIQFIDKYITPNIASKKVKNFPYKTVCYYGCLMVRPHKILKFDRLEDPQSMDEAIKMIGGQAMEWGFKTECCGAGLTMSRTEIVAKLSGSIVKDAADRGAEVIVVACPMCHSNLDFRRKAINKYLHKKESIPVIYITQAIGLACGIDEKTLGLQRHITPVLFPKRDVLEEPKTTKKVSTTILTEE